MKMTTFLITFLTVSLFLTCESLILKNQTLVKNVERVQNEVVRSVKNLVKEIENKTFGDIWVGHSLVLSSDLEGWEPPYEIRKNFPYYHSGYDKEGHPVWCIELGRWDFRKIIDVGFDMMQTFNQYLEQYYYRILHSIKTSQGKQGEPIRGAVLIIDMEDLNIRRSFHLPTLRFLLKHVRKYRQIYLENSERVIILNANPLLYRLLKIISPLVTRISGPLEVYGKDQTKFKSALLDLIPKTQLPEWYGGNDNFKPLKIYG